MNFHRPPLALRQRDMQNPWACPDRKADWSRLAEAARDNHCWICGRVKPLNTWVFAPDMRALLFGRATSPPAHANCLAWLVGGWGFRGIPDTASWVDPQTEEENPDFPAVVPIVHHRTPIDGFTVRPQKDGSVMIDYCIDAGDPMEIHDRIDWVIAGRKRLATQKEIEKAIQLAEAGDSTDPKEVREMLALRGRVVRKKVEREAAANKFRESTT